MFKDWFDGGGFGQSGSTFKGGGILSELANMVAKPVGYSPNAPTQTMRPQGRPQNRHYSQPAPMSQPQTAQPEPIPYENPYGMVRFGPNGEIIRDNTFMPQETAPPPMLAGPTPTPPPGPAPLTEQPKSMLETFMYLLETETDPTQKAVWQKAVDELRATNGQSQ